MDFSLKIAAASLAKDLENLAESVENELNQAVGDLAQTAYANIISNVQAQLHGTRQDYLKGLSFENLGDNTYLIILDGDLPNSLESGYGPFSIKDKMLASTSTVSAGPNAGKPWVQHNKEGKKFAHVPFEHKPFSESSSGDLVNDIKKLMAFNKQGKVQKMTSIFKDDFGKPLQGKVASAKSDIANLNNMVKFQDVSEKGTVSSVYTVFRTVGEDSTGWQNKGHPGYHFFEEAERYVEAELNNIIKLILGGS